MKAALLFLALAASALAQDPNPANTDSGNREGGPGVPVLISTNQWGLATQCPFVKRVCDVSKQGLNDVLMEFANLVLNNTLEAVTVNTVTNFLRGNRDGCPTPEQVSERLENVGFTKKTTSAIEKALGLVYLERYPICVEVGMQWAPKDYETFVDEIFSSLIQECEDHRGWYRNDCVCAQLPTVCRSERFVNAPVCTSYLAKNSGNAACIFRTPGEEAPTYETYGLAPKTFARIFSYICAQSGGLLVDFMCSRLGL